MENIILSICIITYMHEKYIEKAIESVLKMNFSFPWEIIVSDDCSSDNTASILIDKYSNNGNIKILTTDKNMGAVTNIEKTWKVARGKYIYNLEGDDFLLDENVLLKMVSFLNDHPNYVGISSRREIVAANGELIGKVNMEPKKDPVMTLERFLNLDFFDWSATLFRRNVLISFPMEIAKRANRNVGDLTLCIFALMRGDIYCIEDIVGAYRSIVEIGAHNYNSLTSIWDRYSDHMNILITLKQNVKQLNLRVLQHFYTQKVVWRLLEKKQLVKYTTRVISYIGYVEYVVILLGIAKIKIFSRLGKIKRGLINFCKRGLLYGK